MLEQNKSSSEWVEYAREVSKEGAMLLATSLRKHSAVPETYRGVKGVEFVISP